MVRAVDRLAGADGAVGLCAILGRDGHFPASEAAFANACLTAEAVPPAIAAAAAAALALAQETGADMSRLIAAVAAGLAAYDRLRQAAAAGMVRRGHNSKQLLAAPVATLAAGLLLKLNDDTLVNALGVAGSMASGSTAWSGPLEALAAGWSARSAVLAVELAAAGFTGPPEVFEGQKALFAAYAEPGSCDLTALSRP
jgi:2-methylcitrate dehydratase PrpD